MKKLRIILLCSFIFIALLTIYRLQNPERWQETQTVFYGKIVEVNYAETYTTYIIQGEEKFIAYAYTPISFPVVLGQTVRIKGKAKEVEKNRNFYLFNYKTYLQSKKIKYMVTIEKMELQNERISLLYKIKNAFLTYLESFDAIKEYMVLLLYGENRLDNAVYEGYKKIGIVHLFAISGMHIQFLVGIFKKKIMKKRIQKVSIFLFLTFYLFLVKPSPGIMRAILCENISILGNNKGTRREILVFVFFCMLLYNPYFLYHVGFQLSFLLSFTLGWIKKGKYIVNLWKTAFVSFLASFPIVVNMSFEINFLTPFYNLCFVPFVSYLLFPSLVLTLIVPALEPITYIEILFLEGVTERLSQIPSFIFFGYFSLFSCICFYFLLTICFYKKKFVIFILLFLIIHYFKHDFLRENRITLLDVGQGDSILIEDGLNRHNILIDTGGEKQKSKALSVIVPSLKARGIHKLDAIVLSHGDFDHAGSTIELLQNFKVEKVYLNGSADTKVEAEILAYLKKNNILYKKVKEEKIEDKNLGFTLFHFKNRMNENEDSLVTYMNLATYNILLMGDAGEETEKRLIARYKLPKMDILKVGHHGSKYSSTKAFLKEIEPKYALISVGKNNTYGHPSPDVINRLTDVSTTILKTSTQGSIALHLDHKLSICTCLKPATQ